MSENQTVEQESLIANLEAELRENKQRLRAIVETAHEGIWQIDAEARTVYVNQFMADLLGYTIEEMQGRSLFDFVDKSAYAAVEQNILRRRQGIGEQLEHRYIRKDGSGLWASVSTHPIFNDQGEYSGVLAMVTDIAGRKRAEEELRESEERTRFFLEQVPATVWATDLDLRITLSHGGGLKDVGFRSDEQVGRSLYDILGSKDPEFLPVGAHLRALEGESVRYETEWRGRNFETHIRPFRASDGSVIGTVGIAIDLTERKRAEASFIRYNERLQILLEIDQAILAARSPEEIAAAALSRLKRLVPFQCAGVAALDMTAGAATVLNVEGDCRDKWKVGAGVQIDTIALREVIEPLARGVPFIVEDIAALPPLDPVYQFFYYEGLGSCLIMPLLSQDELVGVLGLGSENRGAFCPEVRDMAREVANRLAVAMQDARLFEQVRVGHEQLQILSRRLLEAQETERRQIAHELHDEIGQALTAVKLNLQTLQQAAEPSGDESPLRESIATVDAALRQVRDLSLDLRPSLLDDLGLVAALRWHVDRHARRTGLIAEFIAHPMPERPPQAIETACFRVAQESLTNIARHAGAQRVSVELGQVDGVLRLRIQDDGKGFDVSAARGRALRGYSLGLLGMEERAYLAGGTVHITSVPEQGTVVTATFPLPQPAATAEPVREGNDN